jgi:hypothetical protein
MDANTTRGRQHHTCTPTPHVDANTIHTRQHHTCISMHASATGHGGKMAHSHPVLRVSRPWKTGPLHSGHILGGECRLYVALRSDRGPVSCTLTPRAARGRLFSECRLLVAYAGCPVSNSGGNCLNYETIETSVTRQASPLITSAQGSPGVRQASPCWRGPREMRDLRSRRGPAAAVRTSIRPFRGHRNQPARRARRQQQLTRQSPTKLTLSSSATDENVTPGP